MAAEPNPTQYICWVQRSLIRNSCPDLKVDGNASSPAYRDAVKRFRIENGITKRGEEHKPGNDSVDEPTQDQMIRLNHSDPYYTEWVQSALINKGLLKPGVNRAEPMMELPGSLTRQALRVFQKASGLKVDGWVGSKTELALMKSATTEPPDDTGKPVPTCKRKGDAPPVVTRGIEAISVWLNVFIPNDLPNDIVTRPFAGPHVGKVFLRSPFGYFASDQRSWSKHPDASSRMHSRVDILLRHGTLAAASSKQIGSTIQVDRFGVVVCNKRASTESIRISSVREAPANTLRFNLSGEGPNPCSPSIATPDIDYSLDVSITLSLDRKRASMRVIGGIDEFPSFEMYAVVNDDFDETLEVFRRRASPSPFDLIGGAERRVDTLLNLVVP